MTISGPSLHDVTRRLDEIAERLEKLAARIESGYVRIDLFEATKQLSETERGQLDIRLSKLENRSEWIVRTVGGIIIAAVLGLVIAASKLTSGG
jgi:hypothetical protein